MRGLGSGRHYNAASRQLINTLALKDKWVQQGVGKMFGNILARASGGGQGGDESTLAPVNNDIFNNGDAVADFDNMLLPPAGGTPITQLLGGDVPPLPQGGAHVGFQPLGVPLPFSPAGGGHPPPTPLHQPGGGGNACQQPAAGDKPYSGISSAMKKLGHTM